MKRGVAAAALARRLARAGRLLGEPDGRRAGAAGAAAAGAGRRGDAEQTHVPLQVTTVGTVQAYTTVGVKSQVAGQIDRVHFTEGQEVKQRRAALHDRPAPASRRPPADRGQRRHGPRPAPPGRGRRSPSGRPRSTQALANLERDAAQIENARVQEQRYRHLVQQELVAREQYDQVRTALTALQATRGRRPRGGGERPGGRRGRPRPCRERPRGHPGRRGDGGHGPAAARATRPSAAPMDGRTGNLLVQAGNVVKSNEDNPLVVIAQVRPIYVSFAVPEQHLTAHQAVPRRRARSRSRRCSTAASAPSSATSRS